MCIVCVENTKSCFYNTLLIRKLEKTTLSKFKKTKMPTLLTEHGSLCNYLVKRKLLLRRCLDVLFIFKDVLFIVTLGDLAAYSQDPAFSRARLNTLLNTIPHLLCSSLSLKYLSVLVSLSEKNVSSSLNLSVLSQFVCNILSFLVPSVKTS